MKELKKYLYRFDKELNLRQRIMMVIGAMALLIALWNQQWLDRYQTYEKGWKKQVEETIKNISELRVQVADMEEQLRNNPEQELSAKITQLEKQIQSLNFRAERENRTLTQPSEMVDILHHFLKDRGSVKLISWENSKLSPLNIQNPNSATNTLLSQNKTPLPTVIFRRDYKLVLKGDFLSILNFLEELENTPWIFYWEKIHFNVISYPESLTTLNFFTLTLNEEIIGD